MGPPTRDPHDRYTLDPCVSWTQVSVGDGRRMPGTADTNDTSLPVPVCGLSIDIEGQKKPFVLLVKGRSYINLNQESLGTTTTYKG